jgi:hypothetical protein
MTYRVIQWATGGVGRAAIEGILDHPELELVGCWVHSEDKVGRDVGEFCGRAPVGVKATNDVDGLVALDADCVVYSPIMANESEVIRLLESGKNVVTPLNWFYPFGRPRVGEMEAACRKGGVTLHGTGIHPGGITERFPIAASALSRAIRHVRAEEFSDIRTYGAPWVVGEMMLFGKTPEQAKASQMLKILGAGFLQSVDMVAASLGVKLDAERRSTHEMAVATAPIESPVGTIQPGHVAGQRFTWQGLVAGEPVVTARVNWLMGEKNLEPAWRFGPGGERFEVEITGDPPVQLTFHGLHPESIEAGLERNAGVVATAMHCVNAVPTACQAAAGIRTYLDLPSYGGRAAPELIARSGA